MKKPDEDVMISKAKATWQTYKDERTDNFKKLVSPDLVAMNANGVTKLQDELETMSKSETKVAKGMAAKSEEFAETGEVLSEGVMRISMNTALSGSGRVDSTKWLPLGEIRGLTKLVKYLTIILLLAIPHLIHAKSELTADESIPIPKVQIDAKGNLQITASPTSSASDFDFLVGKWKMHNRHLNKRLEKLSGVDGIRLLG
jgi:hypothetical protein